MPGKIVEINTREEYKKFIAQHKYCIVKVSAGWCGPCQRVKPWFMERFNKMPDNVHLILVDADEGDLANGLRVKSIPHIQNVIEETVYEIYPTSDATVLEKFFVITEQRSKLHN
tara:strand:+ start:164 stop:505 length:342 start_codon:yes stop_codon:yes gene_type:complete